MSWKVEFNIQYGIIHIVFSGMITNQEALDATKDALALAAARGDGPHLFLAEILDVESHLSTVDIYDKPSEWDAAGANRANRLALLVPEEGDIREDALFYETTCRNQGWQVAVFSQRQEAIDWLTS